MCSAQVRHQYQEIPGKTLLHDAIELPSVFPAAVFLTRTDCSFLPSRTILIHVKVDCFEWRRPSRRLGRRFSFCRYFLLFRSDRNSTWRIIENNTNHVYALLFNQYSVQDLFVNATRWRIDACRHLSNHACTAVLFKHMICLLGVHVKLKAPHACILDHTRNSTTRLPFPPLSYSKIPQMHNVFIPLPLIFRRFFLARAGHEISTYCI